MNSVIIRIKCNCNTINRINMPKYDPLQFVNLNFKNFT